MSDEFDPIKGTPDQQKAAEKRAAAAGVSRAEPEETPAEAKPKTRRQTTRG